MKEMEENKEHYFGKTEVGSQKKDEQKPNALQRVINALKHFFSKDVWGEFWIDADKVLLRLFVAVASIAVVVGILYLLTPSWRA